MLITRQPRWHLLLIDTDNGLRNEFSFSIKGTEGTIEKGEYNKFIVNSKNNTFALTGEDASSIFTSKCKGVVFTIDDASTKKVTYKHSDVVITTDISGTEHEYYKEGTDAYKEALKNYKTN